MLRRLLLSCIVICVSIFCSYAQKTIWGSSSKLGNYNHGYIFKTDSVGNSPQIMYHFKGTDGSEPGLLFKASNGKLYGLTSRGGQFDNFSNPAVVGGVLFEYDMMLDSLKVLHHFNANGSFPYDRPNAEYGLIEASPGVLYGIAQGKRIVFKFTIASNSIALCVTAPTFVGGTYNDTQANYFEGPLYMASNGFMYSALQRNSTCPIPNPDGGGIARINISNNTVSTVFLNPCSFSDGLRYSGPKGVHDNKLYSLALGGDPIGYPVADPGRGVIYEFNPTNNAYSKKINFAGTIQGQRPTSFLKANNGKFYGTAEGGTPYTALSTNFANGSGIIYEYNPTANTLNSVHEFRYDILDSIGEYGVLSLCASNNKLYGTTYHGIFEYNPSTDLAKPRARINCSYASGLIEACRIPSYAHYTMTTYTVCEGSPFTFDVGNENASSVVWKKNNNIQANHTNSVLHFDNISMADAGSWTCTLTNECGTITTPAIQIVVNTSGTGTVTSVLSPSNISICEGSSTVLSGNNGGIWNTGASTASIIVSQAGQYQVTNTNACGNTYSNVITVSYIPTTTAPVATRQVIPLCANSPIILSGNTNGGVWNTGATTASIQVPIVANAEYYIVNTHACGTDTSNIIKFYPNEVISLVGTPVITASGPTTFCQSGSVTLMSNHVVNPSGFWLWNYTGGSSNAAYGNLQVTQPGQYILSFSIPQCSVYKYDTVNVAVEQPMTAPIINALGPTTFCANGSVDLQSNVYGNHWNTGDTSSLIHVIYNGTYYSSKQNSCGTVTSNSVTVTTNPLPVVNFTPPSTSFCTSQSAFVLSGGTPAGGVYSGAGVSGGMFDPLAAGAGIHNITYMYTDGNGCANSVVKAFSVASPSQALLLSTNPSTNSFCQGGQILLFQTQFVDVQWSDGTIGNVLFVNQPGNYYYTTTTACGLQTSNTIQVTMNPIPAVSYQQTPNTICTLNGNITLSEATPLGGIYSGTGVSGNIFNPNAAGAGTHTITYSYTENGCTGTAQQTISVGTDTAYITPLSSTTFCQGDSVILQGNSNSGTWSTGVTAPSITVYQSGTYFVSNSSACGTVSSQQVDVEVLPSPSSSNQQTICAGSSYSINGETYTSAGTYTTAFQAANGCDSLVTTQLTVSPVLSSTNPQSICAGDSYSINGQTYTLPGNYATTFQSLSGCDSIVTTQLSMYPMYNHNNPQTICSGDSYSINGQTYTSEGNYVTTFQSVQGCDSIITTQLSVTDLDLSVNQEGPQLSANLASASYQWISCGQSILSGQTQQTFVAMQNGNYAVIITADGCTDTSACYEMKNVSITESNLQTAIVLFPNPAVDQLQINTSLDIQSLTIQNAVGETIMHVKGTKQLLISTLAAGTYFINVETAKGIWKGKFVKID